RRRHTRFSRDWSSDVCSSDLFSGEARGLEGQPLAWVTPRQLADYEFPAANRPIVAAARLPDRYLITPEGLSPEQLLRGVRRALKDRKRVVLGKREYLWLDRVL